MRCQPASLVMNLYFLVLSIAAVPVSPLGAQEPDYALQISGGLGVVDEAFEAHLSLTVNGDDVEEFSFTVCDDRLASISITEVELGADLEGYELLAVDVDQSLDGWSASVVLDAGTNTLASGGTYELFVANYELLDTGTSTLEFCDGAVGNLVNGFEPALEGTSIEIVPFLFLRGDANGDGVVEPIRDGAHIMNSGFLDPDYIWCRIAADADGSGTLSGLADGLYLFYWALAGGPAPPDPGPYECGGPPDGSTLGCAYPSDPCVDMLPADPDPNYVLSVGSAVVAVDRGFELPISLDSSAGEPLIGVQFSVCHDEEVVSLDLDGVDIGPALEEAHDGNGPDLVSVRYLEDGWTVGLLMDAFAVGTTIESGDSILLFEASYTALAAPATTSIEFCTLGDPEIPPRVMWTLNHSIAPTVEGGTVEIVEEGAFLRGDANGDGGVDALEDAIYLLLFGFVDGTAPPCRDAADVDDSGIVSPLLDALVTLQWGFLDGAAPPDPGPATCGLDPSPDEESCVDSPDACR